MKLLFIFKSFGNGGVASVMIEKLNYLSERENFEIHILSVFPNNNITIKRFTPKIHIHVLSLDHIVLKPRLPIIGYFQLLKDVQIEYQKFIDKLKPDIITGFNYGYNREIIPFLKTKAIKVLELHGAYVSRRLLKKTKRPIDYLRKKTSVLHNKYDYAITLTQEDTQDRKYLKIPTKHIYNSIFLPAEISLFENRSNIILAVGTLTHNKNFIDLIKAANKIKEKLKNWQIFICGEGVEKEFLQNAINEYALQDIVILKGHVFDMQALYNNAKLLISTSLSEGFGRTMTEALSYKIPVIAYDCKCGPKEIIADKVNGFVIPFSYEVLAEKISELIDDEKKLQSFSKHSYDDLNKFDNERIMQEWVTFYKEINNEKKD